jgi:hypothetical protein
MVPVFLARHFGRQLHNLQVVVLLPLKVLSLYPRFLRTRSLLLGVSLLANQRQVIGEWQSGAKVSHALVLLKIAVSFPLELLH